MERSNTEMYDREAMPDSYLLLDGAMIDALMLTYKHDDSPWVAWLYRGTRHESAIEASPLLVKPSPGSRLWDNSEEWSRYGIVLKTRVTKDALLGHLQSLISIRLPSGQLSYCRFYAQSHLANFLGAMDDSEKIAFSGPIECWMNPTPDSGWQTIEIASTGSIKQLKDEGWFQLTQEQLDRMKAIKRSRFIGRLADHLGLAQGDTSLSSLSDIVQQAETQAFVTEKDIAHYAEMAVHHGERLNSAECQAVLASDELTNFEKLAELDHLLTYGGA
ncbi:DUF4123 domain-containing protein [Marinobacter halodurans]|uniref:DUF4123 domain-containing protein n=1 Tax=Marinobacter halodurans TaxID=2528979 RepID=A0ABY1ZDD3_9GAMM|nr:DUF4123 domain-containing protein [Marinobacter halodurans]TBW45986.1 DUF4123 domain-containing protein [Marinobacter halodurans]